MNQGYFAPILNLSSYKHLLYFVSSWLVLAVLWFGISVIFRLPLLPENFMGSQSSTIGVFKEFRTAPESSAQFSFWLSFLGIIAFFMAIPLYAWLGLRLLDFERWRVRLLLEGQIKNPLRVRNTKFVIWMSQEVLNLRTFQGFTYLFLQSIFGVGNFILLGAMLYITGLCLFAPIIAAWQPAPNAFSYWRDSVVWTGSEGLKFTAFSSAVAFLAGIPMLNLTLQFSNFLARVWRVAAENALSSDTGSQRSLQALETASKSVLEESTDKAITTILQEGLNASSASGASIGETRINLEPSDFDNPKNVVLRVPLEQNAELLALYKIAPPNARDISLWKALGIHASTALKLQNLLTRERATASEQERARIARELHDSVAQALYGIALGTRSALEQLETNPENAKKSLEYAIDLADGGTSEMKTLLFALRPDALEEGGLAAALQKLGEMLLARYKLDASVTAPLEPDVTLEVKGALYRIAQETVHNTVKHAKAKEVRIRLETDILEISDNGHGFDMAVARAGALGIKSMRERAEAIGAALGIESDSDGTRIIVNFGGAK